MVLVRFQSWRGCSASACKRCCLARRPYGWRTPLQERQRGAAFDSDLAEGGHVKEAPFLAARCCCFWFSNQFCLFSYTDTHALVRPWRTMRGHPVFGLFEDRFEVVEVQEAGRSRSRCGFRRRREACPRLPFGRRTRRERARPQGDEISRSLQ